MTGASGSPILIAGFHRSGTSAVARLLAMAGLSFGDNLLGSGPDNPYGHFEDLAVVAAHDAALNAQDLTWKSTSRCPTPRPELRDFIRSYLGQAHDEPFGIKDPRLCLFLCDWLDHAPDAKVIVVLRRPGPTIDSLHRRHVRRFVDTRRVDPSDVAFWKDPDLGLKLWLHYGRQLLEALDRVEPSNQLVVEFDERDQLAELARWCNERWQLGLSEGPHHALDADLGRSVHETTIGVRDAALIDEAAKLWRQFSPFFLTRSIK